MFDKLEYRIFLLKGDEKDNKEIEQETRDITHRLLHIGILVRHNPP